MSTSSSDQLIALLDRLPPRVVAWIEPYLTRLPAVREQLEGEYQAVMDDLEHSLKPYKGRSATYDRLPSTGQDHAAILQEMQTLQDLESARWQDGYASGAVYHGDSAHIDFLNEVYALHSQANPLHADLWPSATKFEAEIVAMTAQMLGADHVPGGTVCGTVSSGGTESILLAMKTYRDRARAERGIRRPEMVVPVTAHAAFHKAAEYFNMKLNLIPMDENCQADVDAARRAINRNTVVVVGSAPSYPHGMIDPIAELSALALAKGIGFHTDGCLGGFVLPWAEKLGYDVPPFDFRLPGVTSISADTHKYGYAAKGTSVVLYRDMDLRRYQYYTATDWPGGLYFSPTLAGSRPGGLSAACWASLLATGEDGYMDATRRILETGAKVKAGVAAIPELCVLGDPLWVVSFASDTLDIYRVMDAMTARGWSLNGLHKPACVHLAVTLRHTQPSVAERFITDLGESVAEVKATPADDSGMAPVYGMAATMPLRGVVSDILKRYIDVLYKV